MGFLQVQREALTAVIEAALPAITVYDHIPERLNLPAAIVFYGSPLVESGEVFGTVNVRFTVALVPRTGTNDKATDEITSLIEAAVVKLAEGDFGTESVGQPYMLAANGGTYLAADANLVTAAYIND